MFADAETRILRKSIKKKTGLENPSQLSNEMQTENRNFKG
jgi:hypothetical protein